MTGHSAPIMSVALSPDGKCLLTSSLITTAGLWDVQTGRRALVFRHDDKVFFGAFFPDGTRLVTGGSDEKKLRIWSSFPTNGTTRHL
jgi:WD40 repeat protein